MESELESESLAPGIIYNSGELQSQIGTCRMVKQTLASNFSGSLNVWLHYDQGL